MVTLPSILHEDFWANFVRQPTTLRVPEGFRFLNGSDAQTVLVKLRGNPPHSADPLGMLMPDEVSPLDQDSWPVMMTYEPDGYVGDEDAEKI